jgi:hypothetical protein
MSVALKEPQTEKPTGEAIKPKKQRRGCCIGCLVLFVIVGTLVSL